MSYELASPLSSFFRHDGQGRLVSPTPPPQLQSMDDLRVPAIGGFDGYFSPYVPSSPFPRYQTEAGPSFSHRTNERNRPMGRNKTPDLTSSFSKDLLPSKQASELSPASKPSDSNARHSYLSLEEVMMKLKPLLDGRPLADQQKICLKGVSLDTINKIREKSEAGWENLSIEYFNNQLIVQCPTFGHEILSTLFFSLDIRDAEGRSVFDIDTGRISMGGSADLDLADGFIKSPDGSMYEPSSGNDDDDITKNMPTVVWEVAYGQNEKSLVECLARYVACSLGSIRLAIGLNIEHNKRVEGQPKTLKQITCAFWEADYIETFRTFEESGLHSLKVLERLDEYAGMDEEFVVPAATKFGFVSEFGGEFLKFVVSQQVLYKIFPEDPNEPGEMQILNRHVHRESSDGEDGEQPALTIPFSSIYKVITAHEARHNGIQRRREILKRQLDKENPDDKNDKDRITADIARLKRTRLDNA